TALAEAGVPTVAQTGIVQGFRASAASAPARESFVSNLRSQFAQQTETVVEQVDTGVKASFTEAITKVYFYVMFIVIIAWVATLFIPVLPLRSTMDAAPVAE